MTRAAISHFDGDPYVLQFWLLLYSEFWKGEVDKIYLDICYNPDIVPDAIIQDQVTELIKYPEINWKITKRPQVPEASNPELIKQSKEDSLLLIESDGWIFGKGLVDKYFKELEEDRFDIVANRYVLFPQEMITEYCGFMRNFFFIKSVFMRSIELDFFPRKVAGHDLDCFGYISYQLANLKPRVLYIPSNFVVEHQQDSEFAENKWLHIRQMNSSRLGFGNSGVYKALRDNDEARLEMERKEVVENDTAAWQYYKAIAMRMIMIDVLQPHGEFFIQYCKCLEKAIDTFGINRDLLNYYVEKYKRIIGV